MRLALFGIVVLALTASATIETGLPADVRAGYFPGRSGNVILKPVEASAADMSAVFVDQSNRGFFSGAAESVALENVADVVARSLGVAPVNAEFVPTFVKNDFFDHPVANLMVAIESLGSDLVEKFQLRGIKSLQTENTAAAVSFGSYPASAVSAAASLASGSLPSKHGIVGKTWAHRGEVVAAFSSGAASQVANLADRVSQAFAGQSLTVSMSGDSQLAAAFCPNPAIAAKNAEWNSYCISFDNQDFAFKPIISSPAAQSRALSMLASQVRRAISHTGGVFPQSGPVSVSADGNIVTVTYTGAGDERLSAQFDLSVAADFLLFAELAYAGGLSQALASPALRPLVEDANPDLFAVSIASLTGIVNTYGRESQQFIAAVHLVDAALPKIMSGFFAAYPQRAVAELVLLGSHASTQESVDTRQVLAEVARVMPTLTRAKEFFPQLYVERASQEVCQTLSTSLRASGFVAHCTAQASRETGFLTLSEQAKLRLQASSNNTPTIGQIAQYQINLWTAVFLTVLALIAVYSLAFMDFKKDTIVYGSFNVDRKTK